MALVVAGDDGLDEVSASAPTRIFEVNGGDRRLHGRAGRAGDEPTGGAELTGGATPEHNATLARAVLSGERVSRHRVGDRVCLEPGVPCGGCRECRTGRYNLCRDVRFFATPPIDGAI